MAGTWLWHKERHDYFWRTEGQDTITEDLAVNIPYPQNLQRIVCSWGLYGFQYYNKELPPYLTPQRGYNVWLELDGPGGVDEVFRRRGGLQVATTAYDDIVTSGKTCYGTAIMPNGTVDMDQTVRRKTIPPEGGELYIKAHIVAKLVSPLVANWVPMEWEGCIYLWWLTHVNN